MNRILKGKVEAVKDKTAKVSIGRVIRHKKYFKELRVKKNFLVHNEIKNLGVGDIVEIAETRPISKLKSFRIKNIIEKHDSEKY